MIKRTSILFAFVEKNRTNYNSEVSKDKRSKL